jgi:hypothetical protein
MIFPSVIFQLKELEKMGPKKGVISQSVKDVVQSLVDDDLVLKDKTGTSVRFTLCNCSIELISLVIQKRILMVLNSMHNNYATPASCVFLVANNIFLLFVCLLYLLPKLN